MIAIIAVIVMTIIMKNHDDKDYDERYNDMTSNEANNNIFGDDDTTIPTYHIRSQSNRDL